jgi:sensor domain CHASE-containing protein
MSVRAAVMVGVLWLASLVAVAATARDQTIEVVPGRSRILSGGEIGFRVDGIQGNVPAGTLVILWNGQWVEPTATKKPILITR